MYSTSKTSLQKNALCVDLDGSLLSTDVLWESILLLIKQQPRKFFYLPVWLLRGKAHFKSQIAQLVELNSALLPVRQDVLQFLKDEKKKGREIVLATASDQKAVAEIVQRLGLFDQVLTSDGTINLSGVNKRKALVERFSDQGFDYIGDAEIDLAVWSAAKSALLVQPSKSLLKKAKRVAAVERVFKSEKNLWLEILKAIRVHQWIKNLLIFVPLIMAHKIVDGILLLQTIYAFFVFSLCASSIYILNDLFDLEADRQHPKKKSRPFAAGTVPISVGLYTIPILLSCAFLVAALTLPLSFIGILGLYIITTVAYTFYLRSTTISDIIVLAGLYALRVLAGSIATAIPISAWLLAFSMFFFLSLAFNKRYTELLLLPLDNRKNTNGRGYISIDKSSLQSMGTTSGYLSVLVLALYNNSQEVKALYSRPEVLWLICPLLFYWISRMWFLSQRGEIDDDPIVATLKDPVNYIIGAIIGLILIAASL